MDFKKCSQKMGEYLKIIPPTWNSQSAVMALSRECYSGWEQVEWMDFYFQYLCEKYLPQVIPMNEKVCGTTFFDGIQDFSPVFKEKYEESVSQSNDADKKVNPGNKEFSQVLTDYQHWRQMEWVESYFHYLCEKKLAGIAQIPGPIYQKTSFNALFEIPWIFKVYIQNTGNQSIVLADSNLIIRGLLDFQYVGVIIASGAIGYKGKKSGKEKNNPPIAKKKNRMKKELRQRSIFNLKQIHFLPLTYSLLQKCETFQPQKLKGKDQLREKALLKMSDIGNQFQNSLDFQKNIPKKQP